MEKFLNQPTLEDILESISAVDNKASALGGWQVIGDIVDNPNGTAQYAGYAQITRMGSFGLIFFHVKVTAEGTNTQGGAPYLSIPKIKALNSQIASCRTYGDGLVFYQGDANTALSISTLNGFGGVMRVSNTERWSFARWYNTEVAPSVWLDNQYKTNMTMHGIVPILFD